MDYGIIIIMDYVRGLTEHHMDTGPIHKSVWKMFCYNKLFIKCQVKTQIYQNSSIWDRV